MTTPRVYAGIQKLSKDFAQTPSVVAIGNFDGVHLGHRAILGLARELAQSLKARLVVLTFLPHPRSVIMNPNQSSDIKPFTDYLTTYEERRELLLEQGIDVLIEEPFDPSFASMSAESFFENSLVRTLGARGIVVGYDFRFGSMRRGNVELLQKLCAEKKIEFRKVDEFKVSGEIHGPVSSTRIRQCLKAGDVRIAQELLGRPYFYRGPVIHGDARGRKIGFPTANQKIEGKLELPRGVYATKCVIDSQPYLSVTNIGVRPTFTGESSQSVCLETHVLDFSGDLYGKSIEVKFYDRLRDEKKFSGIDELKTQIAADVQSARLTLMPSFFTR